jgi:hypothetical protein
VILREFERKKTGAQTGETKYHQDNRVDRKRFVSPLAAALPALGEEQHTADRVDGDTADREDRPRQVPFHSLLHIAPHGRSWQDPAA